MPLLQQCNLRQHKQHTRVVISINTSNARLWQTEKRTIYMPQLQQKRFVIYHVVQTRHLCRVMVFLHVRLHGSGIATIGFLAISKSFCLSFFIVVSILHSVTLQKMLLNSSNLLFFFVTDTQLFKRLCPFVGAMVC